MYVQLNCAIVDPDANNRQELANFLGRFGIPVVAQIADRRRLSRRCWAEATGRNWWSSTSIPTPRRRSRPSGTCPGSSPPSASS